MKTYMTMENADFEKDQEIKRAAQIEENKKRTTCSNCIHKNTCAVVHVILSLPVNRFVVALKQVPFYEGMNKAIAENCFHFENENKFEKEEIQKIVTTLRTQR